MSTEFQADLNGVAEANAELDRMIAADAAAASGDAANAADAAKAGDVTADAANEADAAADAVAEAQAKQTRDEQGKFAKAEADKADAAKAEAAKAEADKAAQAKNGEGKDASRYEKAKGRLQGSWEELNAGKATFQAEREAWTRQQAADKAALEQERAEFEQQRAQAESQFTPEQLEQAAARFEKEGKFDLADLAKSKAEQLRRNPPQKPADRLAAQRKEWALKAATEFKDIAVDNSPLQLRVAQLMKAEPDLERHPKGIYLAARIASLEAKASGTDAVQAKLTEQTKALELAQQKIKELEQLVAPGDGSGNSRLPAPKRFEDLSDTEQFNELERMAGEVGVLTR